ncbi:hypothetical protein NE237_033068 [Protea cynaroides]|uniref:Uncharacterized protein n=1 Tax=Protea cynaroides TaxID=273540 RepID=A0A9Q0L5A1_9MAGN|nr:hypothetical protein NE237_033068 [Protea cynaroides]
MMESQRSHRRGSSSELFICFTSRHSSSSASSMKISSKSILSPARTDQLREPPLSLSSSLSRRLRSNGSMKGGQASPMFPTGNKKRGSTFETPEPSSPKVTCIGQVRVKTKKQGKKMRAISKQRGEVSFRKTEQTQEGIQQNNHQECLPHRNQRWVHIPLTICEALRAFGAEFNCFLPCRSSCSSANDREKGEKTRTSTSSSSSCGAVFAKWLMTIQEGEEEKRTDLPLVVGEENTGEQTEAVDVMEIAEKSEVKEEIEEEEGRVSICIPPRNALLLMRCRSEPFRMSSFANSFWDAPAPKQDDHADENDDEDSEDDDERQVGAAEEEDSDDDDEEENVEEMKDELDEKQAEEMVAGDLEEPPNVQGNVDEVKDELDEKQVEEMAAGAVQEPPNVQENEEDSEMLRNPPAATAEVEKGEENPESVVEGDSEKQNQHEEQILEIGISAEALEELEKPEKEASDEEKDTSLQEIVEEAEVEEEARRTSSCSSSSSSIAEPVQPALADGRGGGEEEQQEVVVEREALGLTEAADAVASEETMEESIEETADDRVPEAEETQEEMNTPPQTQNQTHEDAQEEGAGEVRAEEKSEERSKLPDCLLLMMCEPKLSMEVSKETWVCSTDFIRCRPGKQLVIPKEGEEESKKRVSTDSNPVQQQQQQPPQQQQEARKSCSNSNPAPAVRPPSMARMIEQKLVNAKAYEPFVLTRCKSEPMRSSAKLAPDACFWKNRRVEPHPPTTLGVGGA